MCTCFSDDLDLDLKVTQGQMAENDFYAILNVLVTFKDIKLKVSMVFSPYVACREDLDHLLSVQLPTASLYLVLLNAPLVKDADYIGIFIIFVKFSLSFLLFLFLFLQQLDMTFFACLRLRQY